MTKIDIHVGGTFADTKRRVLEAVAAAEKGPVEPQEHLTFESWEALSSIMTTKRFELLRQLHASPELSVADLARTLKRDYKRVHQDVQILSATGLIERDSTGLRTGYDEIYTRIAL